MQLEASHDPPPAHGRPRRDRAAGARPPARSRRAASPEARARRGRPAPRRAATSTPRPETRWECGPDREVRGSQRQPACRRACALPLQTIRGRPRSRAANRHEMRRPRQHGLRARVPHAYSRTQRCPSAQHGRVSRSGADGGGGAAPADAGHEREREGYQRPAELGPVHRPIAVKVTVAVYGPGGPPAGERRSRRCSPRRLLLPRSERTSSR